MDINIASSSPPCSVPSGDTTPGSASSDSGISGVFNSVLANPNEACPKKSTSPEPPSDLTMTGQVSSSLVSDTLQKVQIGGSIFHVTLRENGRCRLVSLDELQAKLLAKAKMKIIYDFCMADHIKKELFTQLEVTQLRDSGVFKLAGRLKRYAVRVESVHRIINMVSRRVGIDIDDSGYTEWKQYSFSAIPLSNPPVTSVSNIMPETPPGATGQSCHVATTVESKNVSPVSVPITSHCNMMTVSSKHLRKSSRNVLETVSEEAPCLGTSSRQAADEDPDHVLKNNLTNEHLDKNMDFTKPNVLLLSSTVVNEGASVRITSMLDEKEESSKPNAAEPEAAKCHQGIGSQSVMPTEQNTEILSPPIDTKCDDSLSCELPDDVISLVIENNIKTTLLSPSDLILGDSEPRESMAVNTEAILDSKSKESKSAAALDSGEVMAEVALCSKVVSSTVQSDSADLNTIGPTSDSGGRSGKSNDYVELKPGEMLPSPNKWFSKVKSFGETSSNIEPGSAEVKAKDSCVHTETNTSPVMPSTSNSSLPVELSVSMDSEPMSPPSCLSVGARAFKWRGKKLHAFNREAGELISVAEFHQNVNEIIASRKISITYDTMVKILDKKFLLSELDLTFDEIVFLENNDSHPADLLRHRAMIPLTGLDYAFALTAKKATSIQTTEPGGKKKAKKKKRKVATSSDTSDSSSSSSPSPKLASKEPACASSSNERPACLTTSASSPVPHSTASSPAGVTTSSPACRTTSSPACQTTSSPACRTTSSPAACYEPIASPPISCGNLVVASSISGDKAFSISGVRVKEEKDSTSGPISSQLVDRANVLRTPRANILSSLLAATTGDDNSTASQKFFGGQSQSQLGTDKDANNVEQGTLPAPDQVSSGQLETNMSMNLGCISTVSGSVTPVADIISSEIACEQSGCVDSMVQSDAVLSAAIPCQQATDFIPRGYSMSCSSTPLQISGAMSARSHNYPQNVFQWNNPNVGQEMQSIVNFPGSCQIQERVLNYAQPSAIMDYSCMASTSNVTNSQEPSDDSCSCARTWPLEYQYKDRWAFRKKQWEKLKVQLKRCPKRIKPGTGLIFPKSTRFFILKSCDGIFTVKVKKIRKRNPPRKPCRLEVPAEKPIVELDPPMETGEGFEFGMPQLMITDVHSLQPDNVPAAAVYPQSYQPQMAVSYGGLQAASVDQQPQMLYNPGVSGDGMPFMVYSEPMFFMCGNPNVAPPDQSVNVVYDNTVEAPPVVEVEKPKRKRGRPPKIKIKQEKM